MCSYTYSNGDTCHFPFGRPGFAWCVYTTADPNDTGDGSGDPGGLADTSGGFGDTSSGGAYN